MKVLLLCVGVFYNDAKSLLKKTKTHQEKSNIIFKNCLNLCASYCVLLVAMTTNDSSKTAMPLQSYHSSSLLMHGMQHTERMHVMKYHTNTCH